MTEITPLGAELIISQGDEEFWARCSCGYQFITSVKPDGSFDDWAEPWEHHVMTDCPLGLPDL